MLFSFQISSLFLIRIVTIVLLYTAALYLSVVYIQSIGYGMSVFSELFTDFFSVYHFTGEEILLFSVVPVKPMNEKPSGRLTNAEKSQFTLPDELKQILPGLLLGDLNAQKQNVNTRLRFGQGVVHTDYLMHLYDLFKPYISMDPKFYNSLLDIRTGKSYSSIHFNTYSLPCFNELYELFYPLGKKIVPQNIGDLLTSLSLAYWIADDGSFKKNANAVILCTDGFTHEEVKLLARVLKDKFNLECTIYKEKNGFRIRISSKSLPILQTLLKDIMPPMMLHKIGL